MHEACPVTYGVVCDNINAGYLLEALDDHAKARTAEVLRTPAREHVAQRGAVVAQVRLGRDGLADAPIRLLNFRVGVRLSVQRGDDRESLRVPTVLRELPWGLRQLRR